MPRILVFTIVGHRVHLLLNLRSIVDNLLEFVINLLVENYRSLVHLCVQRLQHAILGHEAGEDLLAEWVVLISPDQAVIGKLGWAALERERVQL